ncbi:cell wall hydrolase [Azospirillum picis]|uniref:Spore germination cell wall hydrolase CwlJ-like protein n=1 Tax=Azospirillum picis TaxID=488438 RepID=A0ABU0MFN8_9PROT|nr:cell wall hydrolase [Azospirillum picis]MBP2298698.1 spore germination cell wall hydrolase CwlJ-like protein [Azospirillum picis]MDQ0532253.1 spore germination cell wall hydrolase CwlJ-like protein [Azospirillum picis]
MRFLFLALLLAIPMVPTVAGAQVPGTDAFLCRPDDAGCAGFVGDAKRTLPKRGGARQPVFIGASVFMLTPWEAERERRCLALAGWAEARGEGADAMAAVMWVVANRAASAAQPSLPCRIVVAAGQFEPFASEPATRQKASKAAKVVKPRAKPQQPRETVVDNRAEARRLLADVRRQARVIRAGGMPSWPKPRLAPDQDALRLARAIAWNLNDDDLPDPTARASLFYSPSTQSALGRRKPDWAEARLRTASIGDHSFFRYPPAVAAHDDTQVAEVAE